MEIKHYPFDSIGAYADQLTQYEADNFRAPGASSVSARDEKDGFYGNMSLDRALATGRKGGYWPEALQDMKPLSLDSARLLEGCSLETPQLASDIAGFAPIVPHAIIGVPDAMLAWQGVETPNKMLRIGVGIVHIGAVSRETIFNRGNAILSIIDALELIGFSCAITACWTSEPRACWTAESREGSVSPHVDVVVKESTQRWDPASVAFSLCHAAFGRRLGFRFAESQPELVDLTQSDYGRCKDLDPELFDVTFNPLSSSRSYRSRQEALDALLATTVAQIKRRTGA